VRDEEVAAALGLPEEKTLLAFCADLLGRRGAACLATLDAVASRGMDCRVFAREVLGMLRNLAVLRVAPEATDLIAVTPETLAELQPLAAAASPGHLQSLFEIFLRVETEVRNATFPRMLLELAVLRATRLEEVQEIATLVERLEQFERHLAAGGGWPEAGPAPAPIAAAAPGAAAPAEERPWEAYDPPPLRETAPAATPRPASAAVTPLQTPATGAVPAAAPGGDDLFARFIAQVQREKGMLAGFLEHGRLLKAADGVLEIGFAPQDAFFLETARETQNMVVLRTVARELLGGRAEVGLVTLADDAGDAATPGAAAAPRETDEHRKHRHEALNAPSTGWATEILQAQIVEVKIDR
jgi:DNA polymerase-3 subunit gamma/tau